MRKLLNYLYRIRKVIQLFITITLPKLSRKSVVNDAKTSKKYSGNFDVASDDSFQEDVRSLSDRSISWRPSPIEESDFVTAEVRESREESPTPEAVILEEIPEEIPEENCSLSSKKKKSKKSKVSAHRALFEQE